MKSRSLFIVAVAVTLNGIVVALFLSTFKATDTAAELIDSVVALFKEKQELHLSASVQDFHAVEKLAVVEFTTSEFFDRTDAIPWLPDVEVLVRADVEYVYYVNYEKVRIVRDYPLGGIVLLLPPLEWHTPAVKTHTIREWTVRGAMPWGSGGEMRKELKASLTQRCDSLRAPLYVDNAKATAKAKVLEHFQTWYGAAFTEELLIPRVRVLFASEWDVENKQEAVR